jgi:sialate O-acetylesterase
MKKFCLIFSFVVAQLCSDGQIVLPKIFGDNMVLQRNMPIPIWGNAAPNDVVEIRLNRQIKTVKADADGRWTLKLDAEVAGGPFELAIFGKDSLILRNVLVGEVWLCSGQSNMEWIVGQAQDAQKEMEDADFPLIRHIKVERSINAIPENDIKTDSWKVCAKTTVRDFTAVGYFFAKNIYKSLNIPVGLINATWGGTNIETWISREGFEKSEEFGEMIRNMPKIDLDSLNMLRLRGLTQRIETIQGGKLLVQNDSVATLDFDDNRWIELTQPKLWEEQLLGELDGVVWLRKTFLLTEAESKQAAKLSLSKIDDNDVTYINGTKVGSTNQWDALRNYDVPAGLLKAGKNVIAVKVVDTGGGGGIYGDANDVKMVLPNKIIPLNGLWKAQVESIQGTVSENSLPSLCYNAMINPLIPYAFRGVLWYQGESNVGRAMQYQKTFPLLINDWRTKWDLGNFPFYFVQLATFTTQGNSNEGCAWAELREAQTQTLSLNNTAMCVTTDIGNPNDIHPTNKQTVGLRLAAMALHNLYQKPRVCYSPMFKAMQVKDNQAVLSFDNIGAGLMTPDKYGYLRGFEIAGADQQFYFAKAYLKDNTIVVQHDNVSKPLAVRYGWMGDASECNVFNKEGFPLSPFRTDRWKSITGNGKYVLNFKQK